MNVQTWRKTWPSWGNVTRQSKRWSQMLKGLKIISVEVVIEKREDNDNNHQNDFQSGPSWAGELLRRGAGRRLDRVHRPHRQQQQALKIGPSWSSLVHGGPLWSNFQGIWTGVAKIRSVSTSSTCRQWVTSNKYLTWSYTWLVFKCLSQTNLNERHIDHWRFFLCCSLKICVWWLMSVGEVRERGGRRFWPDQTAQSTSRQRKCQINTQFSNSCLTFCCLVLVIITHLPPPPHLFFQVVKLRLAKKLN